MKPRFKYIAYAPNYLLLDHGKAIPAGHIRFLHGDIRDALAADRLLLRSACGIFIVKWLTVSLPRSAP